MKDLSPQEVNGGVFNVVAYGADPTGTNDSQPAFQAAADALVAYNSASKPATLLIPGGSYKLNSTFRIIGGNATIQAYGAYIFAGSNADLFRDWTSQDTSYTLNGSGLQILGGIWDLKGQNWGLQSNSTMNAGGFSAFTFANSSQITMRDVTIRNVYNYHAIDINTCDGVFMDNVRCEGFQNNAIWKTDCRLASTANLSLTGAATIDGVAVATSDRILVKNQTTTSQNGIYVANTAGAWSRATDMDAAGEANRAAVKVTAGTTGAGTAWYVSSNNPTPGTAMLWAQMTSFNTSSRYFSEAIQIDDGDNNVASKNITVNNCYMGPALDGSGLGSFGKLAGSHTDTSGQLYLNIKVTNCTSVGSLSNAIQGYSWSDSIVANNVILGSEERGIRFFFNSANTGPRLSIQGNDIRDTKYHGIEIDGSGSQTFNDVVISGNTIYSTVMNQGATFNSCGIRVDTCNRANVTNNLIQLAGSPSSNQGIYIISVTDGMVDGNNINSPGNHGIQMNGSTRTSLINNRIYSCGHDGIYLAATTTRCFVSGNHIVGASQASNGTYGGITISNTGSPNQNADIAIMGNRVQKIGGAAEAITPIKFEGVNPTGIQIVFNSFEGWSATYTSNFTLNGETLEDGIPAVGDANNVTA